MTEDWKGRDVSDQYTMTRTVYMSHRFSNLIIISNATAAILYTTGTLLSHKNDNQTDTRKLIDKMELPFEIENILIYAGIFFIQFVHLSVSSMAAVIDSLLITFVSSSVYYLLMFLENMIITMIFAK